MLDCLDTYHADWVLHVGLSSTHPYVTKQDICQLQCAAWLVVYGDSDDKWPGVADWVKDNPPHWVAICSIIPSL